MDGARLQGRWDIEICGSRSCGCAKKRVNRCSYGGCPHTWMSRAMNTRMTSRTRGVCSIRMICCCCQSGGGCPSGKIWAWSPWNRDGLQVTSNVDLGGGDSCQASSASEKGNEDVLQSLDSDGLFSTEVSETRRGLAGGWGQ